jgi:hypothetical protein
MFGLLVVSILVSPRFKLDVEELKYNCYSRISKELDVYEIYSPIKAKMIPYGNWCDFISCEYNKCKTMEEAPACQASR